MFSTRRVSLCVLSRHRQPRRMLPRWKALPLIIDMGNTLPPRQAEHAHGAPPPTLSAEAGYFRLIMLHGDADASFIDARRARLDDAFAADSFLLLPHAEVTAMLSFRAGATISAVYAFDFLRYRSPRLRDVSRICHRPGDDIKKQRRGNAAAATRQLLAGPENYLTL